MIGAGGRDSSPPGALAAGVLGAAAEARAGAWPMAAGETQTILKLEDQRANSGYDQAGTRRPIPFRREDSLTLFFEHGLTDRFTLQGKFGVLDGVDGPLDYRGRSPIELGLRALLWRRGGAVASVYAGGVVSGAGLNAVWAGPGAGRGDLEIRFLAGDSANFLGRHAYTEVQVARLQRRKLDKTRSASKPPPPWTFRRAGR